MYLTEELQKKWEKVLNHPDLPEIRDAHKRAVMTVLLENQINESRKERMITEAAPANSGFATPSTAGSNSAMQGYDPVLISLLRRALPNLMAFDVCGVQPMKAPTGLIFAMKSRYQAVGDTKQQGAEALFNEADTDFSGTGSHSAWAPGSNDPFTGTFTYGTGAATQTGEALGTGLSDNPAALNSTVFPEMAFSIEKVSVEAKTRALKAEYSMELAQDLRSVHGLDAETELANILSAEILAEINREVIRLVYKSAKTGAQHGVAAAGTFDLDVDSNGRWSVEKYKGLMVQIEREANAIAKETRRGRGNMIICDSDTASALSVAGLLDCGSALKDSLQVDDMGNTFVGVLNGRFKVYIDPYAPLGANFVVTGFKGANQYDAGLFYCPYVPLQMVRAVDQNSFQPKIGFKTRYGLVANPFSTATVTAGAGLGDGANTYYRKMRITNLL
ncbi:major capsid protein [uncultured Caudovirales phage]|uniref:Major capsid protein n=1 Tax=uncultured Caudovirales phage TaxID=2100421 RepID=A0A6J5M7T3_9CAUD|nr:major capsid protein [uncultured Caudovirales phage]